MNHPSGRGMLAATLLCVLALMTSAATRAAEVFTDPQNPQQSFDKAWAQYEAVRAAPFKSIEEQIGSRPRILSRMALDIFEGYPTDPRRWQAALEVINNLSGYVYAYDPKKTGVAAFSRDVIGKNAWNAYVRGVYEQMLAQPDIPQDTVKAAIAAYFQRVSMTAEAPATDLVPIVDEFTRRFPNDPTLESLENRLYGKLLEAKKQDVLNARVQQLLQSPNEGVRKFAEAKMLVKVGRGRPLDMKFTALDGREVDLEKLRGKVVLIDFWATWCAPCMKEVPQLKKMYEQYRERGFEIIGVSSDNAPGNGPDPDGEAKSAADMIEFVKQHGMSWPTYYDGKFMDNAMNVKFKIRSLPTKYLLDRKGLLVAINLRGEELDAKVKELLDTRPGQSESAQSIQSEGAQPVQGPQPTQGGVKFERAPSR